MHRRDALTALGAAAIGISGARASADDHKASSTSAHPMLAPIEGMHLYLCAFHTIKKSPSTVIEAHHYCCPVADEVHQCVIFDKNTKGAKILGVEYIISDRIYRTLPDSEKKYYHPHSYEVTAGLLIAPGMKPDDELTLMKGLYTTWGKTWHTWPDPKTDLPMGDPILMWAATKDGQIPAATLADRDKQFHVSTQNLQKIRSGIGPIPQIDAPKSVNDVGRQFTNSGPDKPGR